MINFLKKLVVLSRCARTPVVFNRVAARGNHTPALMKLAFVLALPLLLSGCLSLPDEPEPRGVKLSSAMESSAKGDRQDLGGSSSQDNSSPNAEASAITGTSGSGGFAFVSYEDTEYAWQLPVDVSYAVSFEGDIEGITHFTLTVFSYEEDRNFFGLYVGGATVDFKPGSLPDLSVERPWMLESGLTYRHYLNSPKKAFSPYITSSIGYLLFNWDYRNPVFAGGDTIRSDSLNGVEGSVAFGISTRRDSRLSFFGEIGIGGTVFCNTTQQGFSNDVFSNFSFFSVKAGMSVKF